MDIFADIIAAPFICVGWLIVGAIAGSIARSLMGRPDRSLLADIILGILGAIVGGFVANLVGMGPRATGGLELVLINLVIAIIGAVILIAIGRALGRR